MSEHFMLGVLTAMSILVALYGLVIVRQVHREVQENLLTTRTTLDAAIRILQKLNA